MKPIKLSSLQLSGVEIYVVDPAHEDSGCLLDGSCLQVLDIQKARQALNEASESAYIDGYVNLSNALTALWQKLGKIENV